MSTTVQYNGVTIQNCHTKQFLEEAVYDDSGADIIGHRFKVRVRGLIYSTANPNLNIGGGFPPIFKPDQGSPPATYKKIRKLLMESRERLRIYHGATVVLEAGPVNNPGDVKSGIGDVDNGPKPKIVELTRIIGTKCYHCEFEIECMLVDCDTNKNSQGVLSNRWTCTDDIDVNWFVTRVYSGQLRLASQNLGAIGPHTFRSWVLPNLADGYRREGMHFMSSADGLTLEYSITDKMVACACPFPGTEWEGTHFESTDDGITTKSGISIRITAPPSIPSKKPLVNVCVLIAQTKLNVISKLDSGWYLTHGSVTDHLNEPTIEFRMEIAGSVEDAHELGFSTHGNLGEWINTGNVGQPYNRMRSAIPTEFGDGSPVGLLIAALQSPCDDHHRMPNSTSIGTLNSNAEGATVKAWTGPVGSLFLEPKIDASYSSEHKKNPYVFYEQRATYKTNYHRVTMPIAKSKLATGDSALTVDLAPPTTECTVTVKGERIGDWPTMPKPADVAAQNGGGDWKLIDVVEEPIVPAITASGRSKQAIHSMQAVYRFSMTQQIGSVLPVGQSPIYKKNTLKDKVGTTATLIGGLFNP